MKPGQLSSQTNIYCLEDNLGFCYPGPESSPKKMQGSFCEPASTSSRLECFLKVLLIMKRKIRLSLPAQYCSWSTRHPGLQRPMDSGARNKAGHGPHSTKEYSFPELEKKQKQGWRIKGKGSALLSGNTSPDPTCS